MLSWSGAKPWRGAQKAQGGQEPKRRPRTKVGWDWCDVVYELERDVLGAEQPPECKTLTNHSSAHLRNFVYLSGR